MIPEEKFQQARLFESWIKNTDIEKSYIDHIAEKLSDQYTYNLFAQYIEDEIEKEKREVNITLLYNPGLQYGKDFTQPRYETLKKVRRYLSDFWEIQHKREWNELMKKIDKQRPKDSSHFTTLRAALSDPNDESFILNKLSKAQFCSGSGQWIDSGTGGKNRAALMIKTLNQDNFFHRKLKNPELKSILENSFQVKVSTRTMNATDTENLFCRFFDK